MNSELPPDFGRQDEGGTPATLLVPHVRVQVYFDDVPDIRNVGGSYHTSLPTGLPQSSS